ncbi:GNAT family N-acetyltransferase [Rubellimicrobium roseum]|uniref:L-ornithine N(alpha)-acyltransferase n=1 Tax=Rubellimicrobium roseum TaxID=687525 RepID=A0A5C4NF56_9RHOB|nr:GNAT family N-acyltransferase [Rubellimicrobium roseum]TNC71998.1 GNAT family N-acetyltransferase [Rubellimicrobium roseum]
MTRLAPRYLLRAAIDGADVTAAQALRHAVFVAELGGRGGALTDGERRIEADRFDPHCLHLLLVDPLRDGAVVGTTRVLTPEGARAAGGYATEEEFDLGPLRDSGRRLLEVGRTCLHPDHRGGSALHQLWGGLAQVVAEQGTELIFGLASLRGLDPAEVAPQLGVLAAEHAAPKELRPRSLRPVPMTGRIFDRRAAVLAMPALVKAYLRLGAGVGEGAFLDEAFGCIDVCMVLDSGSLNKRVMPGKAAG